MLKKYALYLAWLVALTATAGTLVAQYIFGLEPCALCWYQRAFMYPLVFIIPIGIIVKDMHVWKYMLSLSLVGGAIAVFHELVYTGIVSETLSPCTLNNPCTARLPEVFGFINIIVLSVAAFISIAFFAYMSRQKPVA